MTLSRVRRKFINVWTCWTHMPINIRYSNLNFSYAYSYGLGLWILKSELLNLFYNNYTCRKISCISAMKTEINVSRVLTAFTDENVKEVVYLGRFGALRILTLAQNYSRSLKILDFGFWKLIFAATFKLWQIY